MEFTETGVFDILSNTIKIRSPDGHKKRKRLEKKRIFKKSTRSNKAKKKETRKSGQIGD